MIKLVGDIALAAGTNRAAGLPRDAADGGDGGRESSAAGRPGVRHAGPLRHPAAASFPLEVGRREGQRSQHPRGH